MGERFHHPVKFQIVLAAGAVVTLLLVFTAWSYSHQSATIVLGGDLMLARDGKPIFADHSAFGDALPVIQQADLAIANLESPLTSTYHNVKTGLAYNLCSPSSEVEVLREAGFDLLSIENNHKEDCSVGGETETAGLLQAAGIIAAAASEEPAIAKVNGIKVAVIAGEDITQHLDLEKLRIAIEKVRKTAELVIVSLHWGNEYQAGPDGQQMETAQYLSDAGADVIWGHHPHVLQRMEWLQSTDKEHRTLVIYSLGNLLSDQNMTDDVRREALIKFRVRRGRIMAIEVIPLIREITGSQLKTAVGQDRQSILNRLRWNEIINQN
ncbi:MAG: CapA family protein [Anaerolineaceae bacterium]